MIDGVINTPYSLILIAVMAAVTAFVRFSPFILFPEGRKRPRVITYLGTVLPYAVIGMLVVYCLKGVSWVSAPHGIPELLSVAVVAALHHWTGNVLLSIAGGTVLYMVLVQMVFV